MNLYVLGFLACGFVYSIFNLGKFRAYWERDAEARERHKRGL
jgi:hypothetical protein